MVPDSRYDRLPGYVDETTVPLNFFRWRKDFKTNKLNPQPTTKKKTPETQNIFGSMRSFQTARISYSFGLPPHPGFQAQMKV